MTDRIIDLSEEPAHLSVRYNQLVIEREDKEKVTVPLNELAVLVVSHPRVSYTHSVLSGIAEEGGTLVVCGEKYMPAAMLLPLQGNYLQGERFAIQARASLPTCKRLWQQIVRAKIKAQSRLLKELRGEDRGIGVLISRVKSGDPQNVEAQASRRYWPILFAELAFRRNRDADDCNRHLNYGYAVLRAVVTRAICAAGLHPSLGIHHHNRYNAFCLADDLMEPFRPLVDGAVAKLVDDCGPDAPLDREAKRALIEIITGRYYLEGESRTLFDILARVASSLVAVFAGEGKKLILPEI